MPYKDISKLREYQKLRMRRTRAEWFKKHGPCALCSSWSNLEVHHKNPKKKKDHRIWSWSKKRRNAELRKCKVLCKDCHKKETSAYRRKRAGHGEGTYKDGVDVKFVYCGDRIRLKMNTYVSGDIA